jgi:hypothetical protein
VAKCILLELYQFGMKLLCGHVHISRRCIKSLNTWKGRSYSSTEFGLWYDLGWYELTHCTLSSEYNEHAARMYFYVTSRVFTYARMFWRNESFQFCNFWRKGTGSKQYRTHRVIWEVMATPVLRGIPSSVVNMYVMYERSGLLYVSVLSVLLWCQVIMCLLELL